MSLLDMDERLLDLASSMDVVYSPFVDAKDFPDAVDVTLVEGAVANADHLAEIRTIRSRTRVLVAFGAARMDKGWRAGALEDMPEFDDSRTFLEHAPSEYLSRFYYDSCTYTEATLRFLVDMVGIEQVVLGTDYPAPMFLDDPVNWINGLPSLTAQEKKAILEDNPARLLGL